MRVFRWIWWKIRGYQSIDIRITAGVGVGQSRRCWVRKWGKWRDEPADVILESPWDTHPDANSLFQTKTKIGLIRTMKVFEFLKEEE